MRIHVVSLPHTQVTRDFDWCAYTAKVRKLGPMLHANGHEVILYAGDVATDTECLEHVPIVHPTERYRWFGGDWDIQRVFDRWNSNDVCWVEMNELAVAAIRERIQPGDAIGLIAGECQGLIAREFPNRIILEWGVGYEGVLHQQSIRAFESHAWRHWVAGKYQEGDGRDFDTVIPNSFVVDEYTTGSDEGYLLYLGRLIPRKGLAVVEELAKRFKVITAGQGTPLDDIEHRGIVLGDEKAELIAHATAVLVPTRYYEPFGGVAVEAQLSGVPAITTDFGAFPETVEHGVTGFRCHTLGEFVRAAASASTLDRSLIATKALKFSTESVGRQYDRWLRRCEHLNGPGWYEGT